MSQRNFSDNKKVGQDEFRVKLSLRTKLLAAVIPLITLVVGFVNIATLSFFRGDKEAYVYQLQGVESHLAAQEMGTLVSRGLSFLDQIFAIRGGLSQEALTGLVNRSKVLGLRQFEYRADTLQLNPRGGIIYGQAAQELKIPAEELGLATDWISKAAPSLSKDRYYVFNASRTGFVPILGLAALQGGRLGVVYLDLGPIAKAIKSPGITIATLAGEALFHPDSKIQFETKSIVTDPLYKTGVNHPVSSGGKEYESEGQTYLGSFSRADFGILALSRVSKKIAFRATYEVIEKSMLYSLLGIGLSAVLMVLFAKSLTRSLSKLHEATQIVAKGNFDLQVSISGKDEIGALGQSFNVMSKKISELVVEREEKVRLEGEIAIASTVQQTLFPAESYKDDNVEIRSFYQSASQCGGDWWGMYRSRNKLVLLIADATGHGIPSALVTASARSCFSVMQKLSADADGFPVTPAILLSFANQAIHESTQGKIMMTFFAGVADFDARTLTYSSAGHNPPWLYKNQNGVFKLNSLVARGTRLGEALFVPPYEEKEISIESGDQLILYTDGIIEGKDASGEMFGKKRTRKIIEGHLKAGPQAVVKGLMSEFHQFNGTKALDDDITLAVARFL